VATKAELRAIPDETVAAIYRRNYWDKVKGDDLPAGLDYAMFDFGVNSGPDRAIKFLQRIVGTTVDGKMGPNTLRALAGHGTENAIRDLCRERLDWLKTLGTFVTFGRGWERRVNEVLRDALATTSPPRPVPRPEPSMVDPPFALPPDWEPPTAPVQQPSKGFCAEAFAFIRSIKRGA
jgi:lysozyme family protein